MMILKVCRLPCGGLHNVVGTALVSGGSFWVFSALQLLVECTSHGLKMKIVIFAQNLLEADVSFIAVTCIICIGRLLSAASDGIISVFRLLAFSL